MVSLEQVKIFDNRIPVLLSCFKVFPGMHSPNCLLNAFFLSKYVTTEKRIWKGNALLPQPVLCWLSLARTALTKAKAYQVENKNCFYKIIELVQLKMLFSIRQLSFDSIAKTDSWMYLIFGNHGWTTRIVTLSAFTDLAPFQVRGDILALEKLRLFTKMKRNNLHGEWPSFFLGILFRYKRLSGIKSPWQAASGLLLLYTPCHWCFMHSCMKEHLCFSRLRAKAVIVDPSYALNLPSSN